jgi:hypothetical protein
MKRPLLWVIALLIAAAPALVDVCRVDCERARPPECPLHQPAPHRCSHDHTIGSATLTRAIVDAQRPLVSAIVIAAPDATLELLALDRSRVERRHIPPLRSPRIDVLRV